MPFFYAGKHTQLKWVSRRDQLHLMQLPSVRICSGVHKRHCFQALLFMQWALKVPGITDDACAGSFLFIDVDATEYTVTASSRSSGTDHPMSSHDDDASSELYQRDRIASVCKPREGAACG